MSSKVKKLVVIGALVALILIPLLAVIDWQTQEKLSQPPSPIKPVTLNYTNAKYGFVLKFPQFWLDEEMADPIVIFTSPQIEGSDARTTINVKVFEEVPDEVLKGTLEDYVVRNEEILKKSAQNYRRLSLDKRTVSGLPAVILTWSMSAEETLITKQAVLFKEKSVFIITYASLEELNDRHASAFALVTSTFRFY